MIGPANGPETLGTDLGTPAFLYIARLGTVHYSLLYSSKYFN